MTVHKRQGPANAGRWFARALVVAGGAIAGTAIAWTFAGGASAEDNSADLVSPADNTLPIAAGETVDAGDTAIANDVTDSAPALPGLTEKATAAHEVPTIAGVQSQVAEKREDTTAANDAADSGDSESGETTAQETRAKIQELTEGAAHGIFVKPAQETFAAAEHIAKNPQQAPQVIHDALAPKLQGLHDGVQEVFHQLFQSQEDKLGSIAGLLTGANGQRADGGNASAPETVEPAAAPAEAHGQLTALYSGKYLVHSGPQADPVSERDYDAPSPLSLPRAPIAPPLSPLTVPGGSIVGGHCDGLLLGVPAGLMTAADSVATGTVRSGVRHMPFEPGAQPGVTPD